MKKHTYLFFLSCVLSLSLLAGSLFYGGKVKAASPIFYEGTVDFFTVDRLNTHGGYISSDFQYRNKHFESYILNGAGLIQDIFLIPASNDSNETYTTAPFLITFNSSELCQNGGKLYIGFVVGYSQYLSNPNFSFTLSGINSFISSPSYLTSSPVSKRNATISFSERGTTSNTSLGFDFSSYDNPVFLQGFGESTLSNFPIGVGSLSYGSTSQLLETLNLDNSLFFTYGTSANSWYHYRSISLVVDVPAGPIGNNNMTTVYVDFTSAINGNFKSYPISVYAESESGEFETISLAMQRLYYICPIYVFAISNFAYEPLEDNLNSILNTLNSIASYTSNLAGYSSSEQIAWLNEYQRKSQDAISKASSMAAAAHYDFSKPDINSGDLSQYINGSEVRPFTTLLSSFLSHSKILIILTVAITASIIGYIFFGKRG